jgi:iron complex outermembrane receptor protein
MDRSANPNATHRLADDGNHRMNILTGAWDLGDLGPLGSVTLKSIAGYRNLNFSGAADLDGSPLDVFDDVGDGKLETWSEDLQWLGTAPRLHYVLGLYYYGEHGTQHYDNLIFGGLYNLSNTYFTKNSSYAPFGQATWTPPILNDKLSLTMGLRYSEDHIHSQTIHKCLNIMVGNVNFCNLGIPGLVDFNASLGKSFGRSGAGVPGLSPMANIAYQWTDDLMTYARWSRGYQSGTANDQVSDQRLFNTSRPEKLDAYEAGFKSQWLDNRLRFNADGFLSRYTDQVIGVALFSSQGIVVQNSNAGKSEYWGSEVELTAIPIRGIEATANYAYLAAKFLEYAAQKSVNGLAQFDKNGNPIMENVASQRKAAYAPAHTFTVGLTYTAPPTTAGVFSAHVDTFWTASYVSQPDPPYTAETWAYAVVNGRLQLVDIPLARGSLDLSVFGRNLFDRKYRVQSTNLGSLGWVLNAYGDPRTFGLGLTYHFTAS